MGISSKILKAINHKPNRVMEHYEIRKQSISVRSDYQQP